MSRNRLVIRGGKPLSGEVVISGAKNAALAILAAAMMTDGEVLLENVPAVSDVRKILSACESIGAKVEKLGEHEYRLSGSTINTQVVNNEDIKTMRAGYYLCGALLSKYHRAEVPMPGGCTIGTRAIDQHVKGFEALGAEVSTDHGVMRVTAEELHGAHIYFDVVSVGATINTMLAAVFAKGRTVLENVAKEPHVVDVANFLNSIGARVKGAGTDVIRIDGVERLYGTAYAVIPDQIEAGTFMVMAAATNGNVQISNVIPKHLECITSKLREIGCLVVEMDDAIRVSGNQKKRAVRIETQPYPGFPTDMQAQFVTLLAQVPGTSIINETIFDNRYKYVDELQKMGTNITVKGRVAVVEGVTDIQSAEISAPDLRAGAALVIAALSAEGISVVRDEGEFILRGYENFAEKISALGGEIYLAEDDREVQKIRLQIS